jgi:hypothetical protein
MLDSITPPTDNLYKFLAIGGLVFALVVFVVLLQEQAADRHQWLDAQAELLASGYVEDGPIPTDSAPRLAYYRREAAMADAHSLMQVAGGAGGYAVGLSLAAAIVGFTLWYRRVQRYDDAILRMTAEGMKTKAK